MSFNPEWLDKLLLYVQSQIGKVVALDSEGREWAGRVETTYIHDGSMIVNCRFDSFAILEPSLDVVAFRLYDKDEMLMEEKEADPAIHKIRGQGLYYSPQIDLGDYSNGCPCCESEEDNG